MNYPVWEVPHIGSGWVIGIIAIFHVMISHFAVGGGFYLPLAERKALIEGRRDWLEMLKRHAKFFLVLTGVFGAVSGVGIWFAIGLAHPEATSALIHNFVFAWATEWVFFLVELSTIAVYYYSWNRISDELHLKVGWLYAVASIMTLFIINGILTFMLTPGQAWLSVAGSGTEPSKFFPAFFNPTFWPSLFLRTAVCAALAGVWALVTASRLPMADAKQQALRAEVIRYSSKWVFTAFVAIPFFFLWYLYQVPESHRILLTLGASSIGQGMFTQLTRTVVILVASSVLIAGVVYFLAYRSAESFKFSSAVVIVILALFATASGEYAREMLRKPYVISGYMYSNGVRVSKVKYLNSSGYLNSSKWFVGADINSVIAKGKTMYLGQCASCHTTDGYRSLKRLLAGRDEQGIMNILKVLHENKDDSPYKAYMPPLTGKDDEIKALSSYLFTLVQKQEPSTNVIKTAVNK
ncbi:MAG: cytochrome ubiquinol oxidase subunit I [Verrucomicrobiae bacterium]|nr:cytochrome ubiquinol oxidase subunit I [Verrucomicrobiae bacterium]